MLNTIINTEHVTLRLASTDDTTILKKIYDEAITCFTFAPGYEITSPEVVLRKGALPSNNTVVSSYIYCICLHNHIIGYIEMYLGFPTADNGYISFFYITEAYKDKAYAEEILLHLTEAFGEQDFKTVSVSTSLKTWQDLAFWQSCGFDTILSVEADSITTEHSYGRVELQYII